MRSTLVTTLLVSLLVSACGGSDPVARSPLDHPTQQASAQQAATVHSGATPRDVVRDFLDSLAEGDRAKTEVWLTRAAREQSRRTGGLEFEYDPEKMTSVSVGDARIRGEEAIVAVNSESDAGAQTVSMKLRREESAWRIYGAGVPMGDAEWVINFEGGEDDITAMGEELTAGIAGAMQDAFGEARKEWEAGGSPESIARERASYDALHAVTEASHDEAWKVDVRTEGQTARELLAELLEGAELRVEEGLDGALFDETPDLELVGVSRLQAIEAVCAELGLVPVYPALASSFGDSFPALEFAPGPRRRPVGFSGPFLIELEELEEFPPHSTGEFVVTVRSLGIEPAVLAANRQMVQLLGPLTVSGPSGESLLKNPDQIFYTSPLDEHGFFVDRTRYELVGLLSSVEAIGSIEGTLMLQLPVAVHQGRFPEAAARRPQDLELGPWTATWKQRGEQNQFELRAEGHDYEHSQVRFAPDGRDGQPMGIRSQSAFSAGDHLWADLYTPSAPAALSLKVYETETLIYPFRIEDIPLEHHAEQPEFVEGLSFSGETPIVVQYLGTADKRDPDFVKVALRVENTANKVALSAQVTFEYLGKDRVPLGDFPHSLTGEFDFDGQEPLVQPGRIEDKEVVAFFMPKETKSVRVRIDSVSFVDGTTWEAKAGSE